MSERESGDPGASRAPEGGASIEALLERHLTALRAFVRLRSNQAIRDRESHSDLVQSVCRELLEGEEGFAYEGEAQFRNWLYTAALRKIVQRDRYLRAQQRDVGREVRPAEGCAGGVLDCYATFSTPSMKAASAEALAGIERAFDELPTQQREVITLARVVGLSHAEIAEQLEITEDNSRQLLRRGLVRLQIILDRNAEDA